MTSFIAARGSGRSTNFIPAVPAALSVTTIAFIAHLLWNSWARSPGQRSRAAHVAPTRRSQRDVRRTLRSFLCGAIGEPTLAALGLVHRCAMDGRRLVDPRSPRYREAAHRARLHAGERAGSLLHAIHPRSARIDRRVARVRRDRSGVRLREAGGDGTTRGRCVILALDSRSRRAHTRPAAL